MLSTLRTSLFAAAFVLFGTAALAGESGFANISHQELVNAIESKSAVILDVNGSKSYAAGHIPGSVDYIANKTRLAQLLPADKGALIVAYCGSETCSAYRSAAHAAVKLGYTNVKHYSPGIKGWKESGAPVESQS